MEGGRVEEAKLAIYLLSGTYSVEPTFNSDSQINASIATPVTFFSGRNEPSNTHIISPSDSEGIERTDISNLSAIWVGKTLIISPRAYPFDDATQGHGSTLFSSNRADDEWDMLIMTFDVENSRHSLDGQTTELTVIMPIYLSPQVQSSALQSIMAQVGDSYHAKTIAVRNYQDYELAEEPSNTFELQKERFKGALHQWSSRRSYTDVGLSQGY